MLTLRNPMRIIILKSKLLWLVSILALLCSCLTSKPNNPQPQNSAVIATRPSPTSPSFQQIERGSFTVIQASNEPIALLDLQVINETHPAKAELLLSIQNVSDKSVRFISYGIGVPIECTEYMYTTVPTPRIGYGEWSLRGYGERDDPSQLELKPGGKAIIRVSKDEFLPTYLKPKTFESCPEGHKKGEFQLMEVYFDDKSVWKPQPRPVTN
jgi:hypothetical protein